MRIKHFAGYGCVNAQKKGVALDPDGYKVVHIIVSGDHEWGLYRQDVFTLKRWLLDRFDKSVKDKSWADIDLQVNHWWQKDGSIEYVFKYAV